ncbi:MAG TPA: 7-carboxy-7-deazaguanine synthase QueE [Puia sp.]|nr:7-carboxy-7-deazaguanine synthase QueE [Puia sp.]
MITASDPLVQALPVMESFYTLQGEGHYQGQAAFFIRLAGCDVGCVWCDVKESWDKNQHPDQAIDDLVDEASSHPGRIAVITGGEPLMHDCEMLTRKLRGAGFKTHLETSGAYPLTGSWDWICLSPKKFKAPLPELVGAANELKVVIFHPSDFAWAEKYARFTSPGCRLFLQPEWSKRDTMVPLITDYIKKHPAWEFSLQLHKYIHVP